MSIFRTIAMFIYLFGYMIVHYGVLRRAERALAAGNMQLVEELVNKHIPHWSRGNIEAVQGDTGHAEAKMVTDTYAHGFDADRKLIAQEMDTGFFSKVGEHSQTEISSDMLEQLREMLQQHPELLSELLKGQEDAAAKGNHKE